MHLQINVPMTKQTSSFFPILAIVCLVACVAAGMFVFKFLHKQTSKIILISADGLRPDAVRVLGPEGAPNMHRLSREGAFTANARTDVVYTITLPNHTSMISSRGVVGKDGHGWISNTDPKLGENLHDNRKAYLPSVFQVAHDHGLRTALFASKSKFSLYDLSYDERLGASDVTGEDNGRDKIDRYVMNEDTELLVDAVIDTFKGEVANFTMLHLRDCDSAGHKDGWNLEPGSPYLSAAAKVDGLIGSLLEAIEASPTMRDKTTIILTADHGGLTATKGHGEAKESDNYTIPFFVWGEGAAAGADLYSLNADSRKDPLTANPTYEAPEQPIRNGDAGNLILSLLKLPAIPGSTINASQDLKVAERP
jgi:predicted AlkP superfamily pyrophosphatase or phosphodiesterase